MQTLGDVITLALVVAAILIVPYKIAKAWLWPVVKPVLTSLFSGPAVKDYVSGTSTAAPVMSPQPAQTGKQTKQPAQTDAEQWIERIELDRTKTALIELLVYSGWGVGEIRAVLKGDSGAIGQEVDAARQRLSLSPPAAYVTPIAGRPTAAQFQDDPDIPAYEAPPR